MSDTDLQWEEPCASPRPPSYRQWAPIVAELRANPNRWAKVRTVDGIDLAARSRACSTFSFLKRRYALDCVVRKTGDQIAVYARWAEP